jgi:hypothetical protein
MVRVRQKMSRTQPGITAVGIVWRTRFLCDTAHEHLDGALARCSLSLVLG